MYAYVTLLNASQDPAECVHKSFAELGNQAHDQLADIAVPKARWNERQGRTSSPNDAFEFVQEKKTMYEEIETPEFS